MATTADQELKVFCDACVPAYKALTMDPARLTFPELGAVVRGYECRNQSCARQYATI